ncbi:M23 family metallopeptidase [Allofournierella sp.]|uniref:M23 family metallopeptidase n=1 Tax=Allofournierella sp. TaxID=1940256 RepID=UPI003AB52A85
MDLHTEPGGPAAKGPRRLEWPLARHVLTAGWLYSDGSLHRAVDLQAAVGTPVYAAAVGTVSAVHQWNGTVTCGDTNSYGNMVKLAHGEGLETLYAHLDRLAVVPDQPVSAGEVIGYSGNTGHSFGPHLHFEVRAQGRRENPLCWLDPDFACARAGVYTYGPGESWAPPVWEAVRGVVLRCTSAEHPRCEIFSAPSVDAAAGSLALHERCPVLEKGGAVRLAGMTGTWYKLLRSGRPVYCLALPDGRCVLESAAGAETL